MVETIGLIILALLAPIYTLVGVRIGQSSVYIEEEKPQLKTKAERPQPQAEPQEEPQPIMDAGTAKIMDEWLNGGGKG